MTKKHFDLIVNLLIAFEECRDALATMLADDSDVFLVQIKQRMQSGQRREEVRRALKSYLASAKR